MRTDGDDSGISRREFVGGAAAAGAAFSVVSPGVLAGGTEKSPSDKLNIAGVGVGGRGSRDLTACESENIVALCDADAAYAGHTFRKYPKAKTYADYRRLLDEHGDRLDGIIVATPDHSHAVVSLAAMELGINVYCEKPLAHTVAEVRRMREVAHEHGVVTQMGNQGHSNNWVRRIAEYIRDGAVGRVRQVHCWTSSAAGMWPQGIGRPQETREAPSKLDWKLWTAPVEHRGYHPIYHPNRWRGWWDFGTGALGDMGCHIIDVPYFALDLGLPQVIQATWGRYGSRGGDYERGSGFDLQVAVNDENFAVQTSPSGPDAETAPICSTVRYDFPAKDGRPPVRLTWWDGGLQPPLPPELAGTSMRGSGSLFIGEKGALICGTHGEDFLLLPESRREEYDPPEKSLPRVKENHAQNWLNAIRGEGGRPSSNFDYAAPLAEIVQLGSVAIRAGQSIEWDAQNMKPANAPDAERYVHPDLREGRSL